MPPYHLTWRFRDNVIKLDDFNDDDLQALIKRTTATYKKTPVRKFRESKYEAVSSASKLPGKILSICEQFKANTQSRNEFAMKIYESDMGSRIDMSELNSSIRKYLTQKIILSRQEVVSLLGEPTSKCGWSYKWFCGPDKNNPERVGILSITFDKSAKTSLVLYDKYDRVKWKQDKVEGPAAPVAGEDVWGKAVDGLQLGLTYDLQNRPYFQGERVSFKVNLRNNSNKAVDVDCSGDPVWHPRITDANGKPVKVSSPAIPIPSKIRYLSLGPGKTKTIETVFLKLDEKPDAEWDRKTLNPNCYLTPGEYYIQCDYDFIRSPKANWHGKLTTGKFKIEVLPKPNSENPNVDLESKDGLDTLNPRLEEKTDDPVKVGKTFPDQLVSFSDWELVKSNSGAKAGGNMGVISWQKATYGLSPLRVFNMGGKYSYRCGDHNGDMRTTEAYNGFLLRVHCRDKQQRDSNRINFGAAELYLPKSDTKFKVVKQPKNLRGGPPGKKYPWYDVGDNSQSGFMFFQQIPNSTNEVTLSITY